MSRSSIRASYAWVVSGVLVLALEGCSSSIDETREASLAEPVSASLNAEPSPPHVSHSSLADWVPPPTWTTDVSQQPQSLPDKWIVLTWDGATWDVILPLVEAGRMPNLAALMRRGTYADIHTLQPTESPILWTTVATGMPPEQHGVRGWA